MKINKISCLQSRKENQEGKDNKIVKIKLLKQETILNQKIKKKKF